MSSNRTYEEANSTILTKDKIEKLQKIYEDSSKAEITIEGYTPTSFCWVCGRKLWNKNKPTVRIVDGLPRTMHKFCSKHVDWMSQQTNSDPACGDFWKEEP